MKKIGEPPIVVIVCCDIVLWSCMEWSK